MLKIASRIRSRSMEIKRKVSIDYGRIFIRRNETRFFTYLCAEIIDKPYSRDNNIGIAYGYVG